MVMLRTVPEIIQKGGKMKEKNADLTDMSVRSEFKIQISYVNKNKDLQCSRTIKCMFVKECLIIISIMLTILTMVATIVIWTHPLRTNTDSDKLTDIDYKLPINYSSDINLTFEDLVVSRSFWLAQPSAVMETLETPVSLVIIHHTATEPCASLPQCILQTRHIQTFHIESNGWSDIGYNFLIGGDGNIYEGRGWTKQGAHTYGYNKNSLGVGFIGTFTNVVPPDIQMKALQSLLKKGVELGYLIKDYRIFGGRQFSVTESPGIAFFEVIKTWDRWSEKYYSN